MGFLFAHPAHLIALGFGSGLSPIAPGTAGTLFAWLTGWLLALWLPPAALGWLALAALLGGWWASRVAARALDVADPSCVVIDEIAAFWLVLWALLPASIWWQAAAFGLFRLFDALKPGPVGWADRALHGPGWRGALGIMLDDLVAAALTLLALALAVWLWSRIA
jgi:phosphatidylglycerophosphatase A